MHYNASDTVIGTFQDNTAYNKIADLVLIRQDEMLFLLHEAIFHIPVASRYRKVIENANILTLLEMI